MENKKILMSLMAASISAMAAVPALASDDNKSIISINEVKTTQNTDALKEQIASILEKKMPATRIGESIDLFIDNYGDKNVSIKHQIYEELKLGASGDSVITPGGTLTNASGNNVPIEYWSSCHSACHSACHGSRGWR